MLRARAASLDAFIDDARTRVEHEIDRVLLRAPDCPDLLAEAMRYSVFAGGKRLRPILALAAADAVAARAQTDRHRALTLALPVACAVELIHTYSLIHDDLPPMDNDTLRRGRPTLHVVYGDALAILAGDALQAEAFGLLARAPDPAGDESIARRKLRVLEDVARAAGAAGMVGGQVIDLQAAGQIAGHPLVLDTRRLEAMHSMKTGALIRASATSGALMGGADDDLVAPVERWAGRVGLAFQIVDDILDVEGSAQSLGKTAGKDAAGDKPTYPSLFGLDRSRQLAAECTAEARQVLKDARLTGGWLDGIAEWVVRRRN
jgi:geranylgeranyl pyrophosphate synthase